MRARVGDQRHRLRRPALAVRQILGFQPLEELQHARQSLLVIDVLDRGMSAGRIGRHIILQRHGDVDEEEGAAPAGREYPGHLPRGDDDLSRRRGSDDDVHLAHHGVEILEGHRGARHRAGRPRLGAPGP